MKRTKLSDLTSSSANASKIKKGTIKDGKIYCEQHQFVTLQSKICNSEKNQGRYYYFCNKGDPHPYGTQFLAWVDQEPLDPPVPTPAETEEPLNVDVFIAKSNQILKKMHDIESQLSKLDFIEDRLLIILNRLNIGPEDEQNS